MQPDQPGIECYQFVHGDAVECRADRGRGGIAFEQSGGVDSADDGDGRRRRDHGQLQRDDGDTEQQPDGDRDGDVQQQFEARDDQPGGAGAGEFAGVQSDEPGIECYQFVHGDAVECRAGRGRGSIAFEQSGGADSADDGDGRRRRDHGGLQRDDGNPEQQSDGNRDGDLQQQFSASDDQPGGACAGEFFGVQSDEPGIECEQFVHGDAIECGAHRWSVGIAEQ